LTLFLKAKTLVRPLKLKTLLERAYSGNYRRYMIIPAILFVLFPLIIFVYPGLEKGIDVSGGTLIIVRTDKQVDVAKLSDALAKFGFTELKVVPFSGGVQIQFGVNKTLESASKLLYDAKNVVSSDPQQSLQLCMQAYAALKPYIDMQAPSEPEKCVEKGFEALASARDAFNDALDREISLQLGLAGEQLAQRIQHTEVSPALGELFWRHAIQVLIIAAIAIFIVIFAFFRDFIPTIAIILAAMFDILAALTALAILRIPFSLATVSAMLMLVGYSVDTDIMLTTRIFKGTGHIREDASSALRTGLTMTGTTLIAVSIMALFSVTWGIETIISISIVLLFGLIGDLISTWFMNAPMLLWYVEKKGKMRK
jgi:preprotein translocase subunit SecF